MPKVSEEHKEQRKQQILDAAFEVFKRKGYEKANLKDIVEETGMSRGWIYLYYSDKVQIFEDILSNLDGELEDQLSLPKNESSVWTILESYFSALKDGIYSVEDSIYPAIYEFWISGTRDPEVKAFFTKRYKRTVQIFTDLINYGFEQGEFNPKMSVEGIVKMIMSSFDGIIVHSLAFGVEAVDAMKQIEMLLEKIKKQLGIIRK